MKLNMTTIRCIQDMSEHFKDQVEEPENVAQLEELYKMCNELPRRFSLEIKRVELVPETTDLIANIMIKEILCLIENDESANAVEYENALWDHMLGLYSFEYKYHNLDKLTTEEAFSYAFKFCCVIK
jgi:hypothetical protein